MRKPPPQTLADALEEAGLWPHAVKRIRAHLKELGAGEVDITNRAEEADFIVVKRASEGEPFVPSKLVLCSRCSARCWLGLDNAAVQLPRVCIQCMVQSTQGPPD